MNQFLLILGKRLHHQNVLKRQQYLALLGDFLFFFKWVKEEESNTVKNICSLISRTWDFDIAATVSMNQTPVQLIIALG